MTDRFDAIILGGGPAGATAATLLAQAGRRVLVLEKDRFPRFHIGESLLPATVGLFERLGINEALKEQFIFKPGGKWLYGAKEVPGHFINFDGDASFRANPYSYMVERSTFDQILLERAIDAGADVRFQHDVCDLLHAAESPTTRVVGVRSRDDAGRFQEFLGDLVIDGTGLRTFVGSKLGVRYQAHGQRMGIYAQYRAEPARQDIHEGWFLGQMFYDGWTWLLRLPQGRFSVGAVLSTERFKRTDAGPQRVLEFLVANNPLLRDGMTPDPELISPVYSTGNMGVRCRRLAGEGWVLAGDAAYFVDPCYSSGVHLAMYSAEMIAEVLIAHPAGRPIPAAAFRTYQRKMYRHEKSVMRMVEAFYIASRNTSVQTFITSLQGGYLSRKFVTFAGGDFSVRSGFAWRVLRLSQLVAAVFGNDPTRAPETHPDYLVRELAGERHHRPRGSAKSQLGDRQSTATAVNSSAAASTSPLLSDGNPSAYPTSSARSHN